MYLSEKYAMKVEFGKNCFSLFYQTVFKKVSKSHVERPTLVGQRPVKSLLPFCQSVRPSLNFLNTGPFVFF